MQVCGVEPFSKLKEEFKKRIFSYPTSRSLSNTLHQCCHQLCLTESYYWKELGGKKIVLSRSLQQYFSFYMLLETRWALGAVVMPCDSQG